MPSGTFPPTALEAAQHRSVGVPTNHERDRWIEEQREQILVRGDAVATGVRSEATHIVPTHAMPEKELPFRNLGEGGHGRSFRNPIVATSSAVIVWACRSERISSARIHRS